MLFHKKNVSTQRSGPLKKLGALSKRFQSNQDSRIRIQDENYLYCEKGWFALSKAVYSHNSKSKLSTMFFKYKKQEYKYCTTVQLYSAANFWHFLQTENYITN